MKLRIALSVVALLLWGALNSVLNVAAPLVTGAMSVKQLEDSNTGYVHAQIAMRALNGSPISYGLLLIVLVATWWTVLRKFINKSKTLSLALAATMLFTMLPAPVQAYKDTRDNPEFVEIKSNESAFLIPLTGANKTSQGKFMSAQYLEENKVAVKRIQIPHTLIRTSTLDRDYYVPASKLIVVDRTSYYREWVAASNRGTSSRNEGFEFESEESINIGTGVAIGASVTEENAAKFLYNFGTKSGGEQFSSVEYAFGLNEVMDNVIRGRVQASLAREFGKRPLIRAIKEKADIMAAVEADVKAYCADRGITLQFIGFAAPLNFDHSIQASINKVFQSNMDAQAYEAINKMMPLYQQQADMHIKEGVATALQTRGFPALPSFMVMSDKVLDMIMGWFGTKPAAAGRK